MTTHAHSPAHSKAHTNDAAHTVAEVIDGLHVKQELTRVRKAAMKFTDQAIEAGQAHPKTAAAVLVGTGMLLGSILYRIVAPRPSAAQLIARGLQSGTVQAGHTLLSGLAFVRKLAS